MDNQDSLSRREPGICDPDILQIIGAVSDLLGLAEHFQRIVPIDRVRVERRHQRIERLREKFSQSMEDARAALRVVSSVVIERTINLEVDQIAFDIPTTDLPVLSRGIDQLQRAIRAMTRSAFELEAVTVAMPDEVQRYYKVSQAGKPVLEALRRALSGEPKSLPTLLNQIEEYLERCSATFLEGERWRQL